MTSLWNETDLISATQGQLFSSSSIKGTGVSIDTRTLQPGDIFIALQGENSDGHAYLQRAFTKGAACAIVSHTPSELRNDYPLLKVSDPLKALKKLARYARQRFQGKMIAITGSVGKTTTKDMLRTALAPFNKIHAAEKSYNNHIGVPLTLARMPQDTNYCICEIGMNHSGEIAPLAALVKPDIALITMVSSAHIGLMKSLKAIAMEKSQIITGLSKTGVTILPETIYGMEYFEKLANHHGNLYKVGSTEQADFLIKNIHLFSNCSSFEIEINKQFYPVTLNAPGQHLVYNAALVLSTIAKLNLDIRQAIISLENFKTGKGRGKLLPLLTKSGTLLDESYNASALSLQAALQTLSLLANNRRVAVIGDILELGEYSKQEHLSILSDLQKNTDLVFACGSNMKIVFEHLPLSLQGKWCPNAAQLIPFIKQHLKNQDTVLVKGSHGMHMDQIVKALTQKSIKGNSDAL